MIGRTAPVLLVVFLVALGACSAPQSSGSADMAMSSAPAASAPPMPEGWQLLEDETGRMWVALPPAFARVEGMDGVVAQDGSEPGVFAAEVWAARDWHPQPDPPFTEQVVAAWLEEQLASWARPNGFDATSVRRVDLPAGEAIEIRGHIGIDSGTIEVLAYAIATADGVADLRIFGVSEVWAERRSELELIPLLWRLD